MHRNVSPDQARRALHDACAETCRFFDRTIGPIATRARTDTPDGVTYDGLLRRVMAWLHTIKKLDQPSDFQALHAGLRALFELAVDLTLLLRDPAASPDRIQAWEESAKLKAAERIVSRYRGQSIPAHLQAQTNYVSSHADRVRELRRTHWSRPGSHPPRWTGRNLERDARVASDLEPGAGFAAFYDEMYAQACWHVHGSTLVGVRGLPAGSFAAMAAIAAHEVSQLALLAGRQALRLLGCYDGITENRFAQHEKEIVRIQAQMFSEPPSS